jgi:translation initiation factor IF-2
MSKTRVYELAKELDVDNKEFVIRLEKLGIAVKSHSSTLEDSEVERVKREFRLSGTEEIVEKRIKSTVIRRRAIRQTEVKKETAPIETVETIPEKHDIEGKPVAEIKQEPPAVKKPEKPGEVEKKIPEVPEVKIVPEAKETIKQAVPKAVPQEVVKEEKPEKPSEHIAPPSEISEEKHVVVPEEAPKEETPKVKLEKKKKQRPVEVVVEEVPPRKKAFAKQRMEKKEKRTRRDDAFGKNRSWKEEKQTVSVKMKGTEITTPKAIKRRIRVGEAITVGALARKMGIKAGELISKLVSLGMMVTINQSIDVDVASLVAGEFGYQIESVGNEYEEIIHKVQSAPEKLKPRAPVVTIMGHVDHGKTSLLDAIRETNVIEGEAGGITQAIGAYHVHINDRDIVFIDTPGHEAFTAMRARGAQVTDTVVLVVAADDGVMGQTIEAINHSKAAGVPIIVAINKIDKPNANPDRIMHQLAEHDLVPEAWGGDTIYASISAKQRTGIEELLELILLQADILELKADPDRAAQGIIIESKLDRGRGPVATVLIQEGTLREGDAFVSKTEYGKVRALINDKGERVKEAGPSTPVEVIGFSHVPQAGVDFICVEDEKKARSIGEHRLLKERQKELSKSSKLTLEQLYERIKEGTKEFDVIVKGDVQGSVEALSDALLQLSLDDVKLRIIHSSTGAVTETDIMLASASDAIIIAFNTGCDSRVLDLAEREGITIKIYKVIYDVIADVRAAMEGMLEPVYEEVFEGRVAIRELFKIPGAVVIAGSYVVEGKVTRNSRVRVLREGVQIHDGKILSLKRFKDDVKDVQAGFECGIGIEGFNGLKVGDVIEAYTTKEVERKA